MRALLLGQGNGWRWNDKKTKKPYLGIPKQLAPVDGEPVIQRTARQFKEAGCEVWVIGPDDPRFDVGDRLVTLSDPHPTGQSQDKILATQETWATDDSTVILWADAWYSRWAVHLITSHEGEGIHYFRRPGPSRWTGHRSDESFGIYFTPQDHAEMVRAANVVVRAVKKGLIGKHDHMWQHYAATLRMPLTAKITEFVNTPGQTHIDDFTDDFDHPREYEAWLTRTSQVTRVIHTTGPKEGWAEKNPGWEVIEWTDLDWVIGDDPVSEILDRFGGVYVDGYPRLVTEDEGSRPQR